MEDEPIQSYWRDFGKLLEFQGGKTKIEIGGLQESYDDHSFEEFKIRDLERGGLVLNVKQYCYRGKDKKA